MASRVYSRLQSRAMFKKIQGTIAERAVEAKAADSFRAEDPLEQAKTLLRRRGWNVFAYSVIAPGSELISVGKKLLDRDEVIAMAARIAA